MKNLYDLQNIKNFINTHQFNKAYQYFIDNKCDKDLIFYIHDLCVEGHSWMKNDFFKYFHSLMDDNYIENVLGYEIKLKDVYLVGLNIKPFVAGIDGYGFQNELKYNLILGNKEYKTHLVELYTDHGCCGSGYCSSTDGIIKITKIQSNTSSREIISLHLHHYSTEEIPVKIVYDKDDVTYIIAGNELLGICKEVNGDGYYPSGYVELMDVYKEILYKDTELYIDEIPNTLFIQNNNEDKMLYSYEVKDLSKVNKSILCQDIIYVDNSIDIEVLKNIYMEYMYDEKVIRHIKIKN